MQYHQFKNRNMEIDNRMRTIPAKSDARQKAIVKRIKAEDGFAIAVLMKIYSDHRGKGKGFNLCDNKILMSMARQYKNMGGLSDPQIVFIQRRLQKYARKFIGSELGTLVNGWSKKSSRSQKNVAELIDNSTIRIMFDYKDRPILEKVKTLPYRRYIPGGKCWIIPPEVVACEMLRSWNFSFGPKLESWLNKANQPINNNDLDIPGLRKNLYAFQKTGVAFIEANQGRALIGDEMGLGKTAEALAWLQLHPEIRPAIIIVPASLKLNWKKEANMWMSDPKVQIISGGKIRRLRGEIIVINYDILRDAWLEKLIAFKAKAIILDECHYIKNRKAQRTKNVKDICKGVEHLLCLSGTPIINRPIEMFNTINLINPSLFPSYWQYAQRYCGAAYNGFGWDFNGASNTEELHNILTKTIMLRRLKKDVLKDLPAKTRSVVPMKIKNKSTYKKAKRDFIRWLYDQDPEKAKSASRAEVLARIEGLKQLTIRGKMKNCIKWIQDFLDSDEKLVVFATHKYTIQKLRKKFKDICVVIDGSTAMNDRQKAVDEFQTNSKIRLFIGNIKAAGVGLTLTAASNVCFLELGWTPGEHDQAEDRVHRIGQEASSVNAWYLIANGTIENEICKLLDKKRRVVSAILDGKDVEEESILSQLLNKYRS